MAYRYLIIADDFTGSNDTGIQMKKRGIDVDVLLLPNTDSSSVVLDTESRNLTSQESYDKVKGMVSTIFSTAEFDIVYKKVDSTLRGNIAQEIKAIAEIYQPQKIVFAPALPKLGRITKGGRQYLNGVALIDTELTKDPLSPIITDDLQEILAQTFVEEIKYHQVNELDKNMLDLDNGYLHVFDIHSDDDMMKLSNILLNYRQKILYVGSAGLAEGIFSLLHPIAPVLGIVGSISQVSINQLNYAHTQGINIIAIEPEDIFNINSRQKYINLVIDKLSSGLDVVITPCRERQDYERTLALAKDKQISQITATVIVKNYLAGIVEKVLEEVKISGMFLTGGDIAAAIVNIIGASGCKIAREISPGIVMSELIHLNHPNIKIITKAGAFGHEKDLFISLNKLKEQ